MFYNSTGLTVVIKSKSKIQNFDTFYKFQGMTLQVYLYRSVLSII